MTDIEVDPELGDLVTILSTKYTTTTGRIIYRDDTLIRIRPVSSIHKSVDFPLSPETGEFDESLGVSELVVHEKRKFPHFAKQLSVQPGERLEFFGTDGQPLGSGMVTEVIATDAYDAIRLEGGKVLNFRFLGPRLPLAILLPRAVEEEEEAPEIVEEPDDTKAHPVFQLDLAPMEESEEDEFTYTDTVQREDMFLSFMMDVPLQRQKDPKVMQRLYRETDVYLALKNSLLMRDETGAVIRDASSQSYVANTVQQVSAIVPTPIAAFLPVADVKKVLYVEDGEVDAEKEDVVFRYDTQSLFHTVERQKAFEEKREGNSFVSYIHSILGSLRTTVGRKEGAQVEYDQDVLRSVVPPAPMEGFPSGLPSLIIPHYKKDEVVPDTLSMDNLSLDVQERTMRLLGPSRMELEQATSTGIKRVAFTITPADSAETVGHIVLSDTLASYRSPIRSSVLLWDIVSSESSRKRTTTLYNQLMKEWEYQRPTSLAEATSIDSLLEERLPPALSLVNATYTTVLDSLGLRNLELSAETLQVCYQSIQKGQELWKHAFGNLQSQVEREAALPTAPAFQAVVSAESPLTSEPTLSASVVQPVRLDWKSRESLLASSDLAMAAYFTSLASATFGPVWYALAGDAKDELDERTRTYTMERDRLARNISRKRQLGKELVAKPTLNPCRHVKELEKVYGIRQDDVRMVLFNKCLQTYQAGQKGNYILCGLCKQDFCCKHEVLLLNEFLNPGRGAELHKRLLLEYSGPVFEGNYICKTCGQKIQEIEYDSHLEFDDEGKPLVGRTVLQDSPDDTIPLKGETDETKESFPIPGEDIVHFHTLRMLFEQCGIIVDIQTNIEVFKRCIQTIREYAKSKIAPESVYETRAKQAKKPQDVPPYSKYLANSLLGVMGATVLLELQTGKLQVPIATPGCVFSRAGFPLDGTDPKVVGDGAFKYIVSVVARIISENEPWISSSWSALTAMKKREEIVESNIKLALHNILQIPIGGKTTSPLESMSNVYLEKIRNRTTTEEPVASQFDKLPLSFRPLQFSLPIAEGETPIANVGQFEKNVQSGPLQDVLPFVKKRQTQLSQQIVGRFHSESKESGIYVPNSTRSDSSCCFTRLTDVYSKGFGYTSIRVSEAFEKEVQLTTEAVSILGKRDPVRSQSGTHVYVPWSAPFTHKDKTETEEVDTTVLYKVFLKNCFQGPHVGSIHELGPDYVCRRCGFAYPKELVYLTGAENSETNASKHTKAMEAILESRKALALQSLQGVSTDIDAFHSLEEKIRTQKIVQAVPATPIREFLSVLEELGVVLQSFPPDVSAGWDMLQQSMKAIRDGNIQKEIPRKQKLNAFSESYERLFQSVETSIRDTHIRNKTKEKLAKEYASATMAMFRKLAHNPHNYVNGFVVGSEQLVQGFLNDKPNVKQWFTSINSNHKLLLDRIWEKSSSVTKTTLAFLEERTESERVAIHTRLSQVNTIWGKWFSIWFQYVRIGKDIYEEEASQVVQYVMLAGIRSLLDERDPKAGILLNTWIMNTLTYVSETADTYQRTPEEITAAIAAREELERALFIKKFDSLEKNDRKVELIKKSLGLGDWSVGTSKNLFKYDPSFYEIRRDQRAAMGLPEFNSEITGLMDFLPPAVEEGYEQRAEQDEDV